VGYCELQGKGNLIIVCGSWECKIEPQKCIWKSNCCLANILGVPHKKLEMKSLRNDLQKPLLKSQVTRNWILCSKLDDAFTHSGHQ
jgi:hypothetical protein